MVYFISDGTYTKIGKSKNPLNRIKDLQTSNAKLLSFTHLFDVKDKYETVLHNLFKSYKSESNNEWFNLNEVDINSIILGSLKNIPKFADVSLATFKATQLNSIMSKSKVKLDSNISLNVNNDNIKLLIEDIKFCLSNKKTTRISYHKYITLYNFTKEQISFFVKSARLNKLVANHNNKIK